MPVDRQVLLRYKVLNDCFRNRHFNYTIDDLVQKCTDAMARVYDDFKGVSKRTIQNDINNLQMPPYSIVLDEHLFLGRKRIYRYRDTEYTLPLYKISDSERDKLQDAIDVLEQYEGVPQYDWVRFCLSQVAGGAFMDDNRAIISFQHNPELQGMEYFEGLLSGIANRTPLRLSYKPFPRYENGKLEERKALISVIHPYHLRQFNDRWFLLAYVEKIKKIGVFAIDRIVSFKTLKKPFIETDVDFEEYFDDAVGVTVTDNIEEVMIRVDKLRYPYIKTKPLHWTQTELKEMETDSNVYIRLKVCVNKELEALLLSYSDDIEVVKPETLRAQIKARVKNMNNLYDQCK